MTRDRDLRTRMVRLPMGLVRYLIRRLPQMADYWRREIPFLVLLLAVSVIIREDRSWNPAVQHPESILIESELAYVFDHLTDQVSVTPARLHRLLSSVVDDAGRDAFNEITDPLFYYYVYGETRNFSIAHSEGVNANGLRQLADMLLTNDGGRSPSAVRMCRPNVCPTCGGACDGEGNPWLFEHELTPASSSSSLASTYLESEEGEEGVRQPLPALDSHNEHYDFIPLTLDSGTAEAGSSLAAHDLTASSGQESPTPSCSTAPPTAESASSSSTSPSDKVESKCGSPSAVRLAATTGAKCGICLTGHPDAGLLHQDETHLVCSSCARRIQGSGRTPKCPFCRRKVERVIRVFI